MRLAYEVILDICLLCPVQYLTSLFLFVVTAARIYECKHVRARACPVSVF